MVIIRATTIIGGRIREVKKKLADESEKTRKAREKLKRRLQEFERKITPQAIEKKAVEIHRWIERLASSRIILKSKAITLFDENKNTADASQRVSKIAEVLKAGMFLAKA